ncbi:MAG: FAD-dependent oxidoreductase [Phycisphaerales bacterium]|jgi:glycine/D-amino acid oxidase-like deaminating enzyme|nr:FAD-dependent oxidoreductase [Phycisphaerales bacterium]
MDFPAPDLSDDAILEFVSGLRPCRHGGLRLEVERLTTGGEPATIVHNYGHGGCGVTIGWGTAQVASELVRDAMGSEPDGRASIGVLGAGVAGLTTAHALLSRGWRVSVYAEKVGERTTSGLAGASWLPTGLDFGDTPERQAFTRDVIKRAFDAFMALDRAHWGVDVLPVFEPDGATAHPEYFVPGTIPTPKRVERLPLEGTQREPGGWAYEQPFIQTPRFLRVLQDEITRLGGTITPRRFASLREIAALPREGGHAALINCLALGSRDLFGDESIYPARGMLVRMRPQPVGYILHDEYFYMFPREQSLVLGGCFLPDDWTEHPDEAFCRQIIERHRAFWRERGVDTTRPSHSG